MDSDWEGFWRGTREAAAYKAGGPQEKVLARFWKGFFQDTLPGFVHPRLLDLACGNGAVARFALDTLPAQAVPGLLIFGLDRSLSGLADLRVRQLSVHAVAGDASRLPFLTASIDLVTSQFGLEYAGLGAFGEAARVLTPGGVFAAIAHLSNGAIFNECQSNLGAVDELRNCRYLEWAQAVFREMDGFVSHSRRTARLAESRKRLAKASAHLTEILRERGVGVAGGAIQRLQEDVRRMVDNVSAFEPRQVIGWIEGMAREMESYGGRMAAMLKAGLNEKQVLEAREIMTLGGVTIRVCEPLLMGENPEPAAWLLLGDRR